MSVGGRRYRLERKRGARIDWSRWLRDAMREPAARQVLMRMSFELSGSFDEQALARELGDDWSLAPIVHPPIFLTRASENETSSPPLASPAQEPIEKKSWVTVVLRDAFGRPMKGVKVHIVTPEGPRDGELDDEGQLQVDLSTDLGECSVQFPELGREIWPLPPSAL